MKNKQKKRRKGWKYYWQRNRFYMITLLAFLILSFASLHILQNSLLENAQRTGASLARSFSVEEVRMGAGSLDRMVQETSNTEELQKWINGFFEDIQNVTSGTVDPYAVLNGTFTGKGEWTQGQDYDYASTEWYQRAIEAQGEVIYTDLYEDAVYNREVVTIAVRSGDSGNVLAFDIFPEDFDWYILEYAL